MSAFTQVDLSRLPAPDVVETLDYEAIHARVLDKLRELWLAFDALLESDPAVKISELIAYVELLLRQRVNDAAEAVMLPTATGADLDNVVALMGVERLIVSPGDPDAIPPVPPVLEDDEALRRRTQLALEASTAAGTKGRYLFFALGAHGEVADAAVTSPAPGEVLISVIANTDDEWAPSAQALDAVNAVVQDEDVRALCDLVTVEAATLIDYEIDATLTFLPGAVAEIAEAQASANIAALVADRRMGRDVTRSALFAALHVQGVHNVTLTAPAADVIVAEAEAARCIAVTVTNGGVDD